MLWHGHQKAAGLAESSGKSLLSELAEELVWFPAEMSVYSNRWPQLTIVAVISAGCALLCFLDSDLTEFLRYDRGEISLGQWWRFFSANFLHTNGFHLGLNLVALAALTLLMDGVRLGELLTVFCVGAVSVTVGLYLFVPQVYGYVGLSGALHALFVLVTWGVFGRDRVLGALLALVLLIKLGNELWRGPSEALARLIAADVVTEAHFFGVLGGILGLLLTRGLGRRDDEQGALPPAMQGKQTNEDPKT